VNLLLLQPYVPGYRVPLFDRLDTLCRASGGTLTVIAGEATGKQMHRRDAGTGSWAIIRPRRSVRLPGGSVYWRDLGDSACAADVVVAELDAGNLDAWKLLLHRHSKLILWGHGDGFSSTSSLVSTWVQLLLSRCADGVMVYSPAARDLLLRKGLPARKVASIGNATDTASLRQAFADATAKEVLDYSRYHGLEGRRIALFVGGLDGSKRPEFLLDAARQALSLDDDFLLVVAGRGTAELMFQGRRETGVHWVGHLDRRRLGVMAHLAESVWIPGGVGLVAVDAQALGLPVITVAGMGHGPEVEFLETGREIYFAPDNPRDFARFALTIRKSSAGLPDSYLSVEGVAQSMFDYCVGVAGGASL
jgi:glycosyltransferase involved in cell wall biosynthesis